MPNWNSVIEPRRQVDYEVATKHPDDGHCIFVIRYNRLHTFVGDHLHEEENVYMANIFQTYGAAVKRVAKIVQTMNRHIDWYNQRERLKEQSPEVYALRSLSDWLPRPFFYPDGYPVEPQIISMKFGINVGIDVSICEKKTEMD